MEAVDLLIIAIALAAVVTGWRKGLVTKLGRVAGVLAGIVCSRLWAPQVGVWLMGTPDVSDSADTALLNSVVAYVVVFIAAFLAVTLLCSSLKSLLRLVHVSVLDRLGGVAFTLLEYMLMVSLALNLWVAVFPESTVRTSSTATAGTEIIGTSVLNLAPDLLGSEKVRSLLDDTWHKITEQTSL